MDKPLDILVVGGGSAGRRHFQYLQEHGQNCAVCDPDPNCRVMKQFPDARRLDDYEVADLSRFDAVVICTPPFVHVPQMIAAATANCHVLTEKPLTVLNNDGLDELSRIVAQNKVVAAVSFPYANMKAMDRIVELVRAGRIGKVRSVHIHHGQNILKARPDYFQTYYARDDQGGGVLQDDAMHVLMGLEILLGPEQEVTCQRHNVGIRRKDVTSDDTVFLWIRYPQDVVVTIDFTMQCHLEHYEWILNGERGAMRLVVLDNRLEVLDAASGHTTVETFDDSWDETFRSNDHNFVAAIRGNEPVRCTLDMGITNHLAVLAGRQSAREGRAVAVERVT
jgi:predicted dehydrogenase